jgi:hypothetical protein
LLIITVRRRYNWKQELPVGIPNGTFGTRLIETIDSVWRFNHYNNKTISPDKNDLLKQEIKDLADNYLSLEHENLLDLKFTQSHFKAETKKYLLIISEGKVFENEELFSKHFDLVTNKFIEALEIRTIRGLNEC